jgi:hypothetical protein
MKNHKFQSILYHVHNSKVVSSWNGLRGDSDITQLRNDIF